VSHLADSIVVLRHVEYRGELRKVIGVLKMRTSDFETGLRMLEITGEGLVVGDPLPELRGILTGTPDWHEGD
jgi:circadian clock protein KaiC